MTLHFIEARVWIDPRMRRSPFGEGYSPHLVARGTTTYAGVRVFSFDGNADLKAVVPGEVARVLFVLYLDVANAQTVALYAPLQSGAEFEIREGAKTVGCGCVIRRFEEEVTD